MILVNFRTFLVKFELCFMKNIYFYVQPFIGDLLLRVSYKIVTENQTGSRYFVIYFKHTHKRTLHRDDLTQHLGIL